MGVPGRKGSSRRDRSGERIVVAIWAGPAAVIVLNCPAHKGGISVADRLEHRQLADGEGTRREVSGEAFDP